jgi:hypothetical protein
VLGARPCGNPGGVRQGLSVHPCCDDFPVARQTDGRRKSEAELIAESYPRCDYCREDTNPVVHIAVDEIDRNGRSMMGLNICSHCIPRVGLTGWSQAAGGWPNPLGHDEPLREEGDKPAAWQAIAAALEGHPLAA